MPWQEGLGFLGALRRGFSAGSRNPVTKATLGAPTSLVRGCERSREHTKVVAAYLLAAALGWATASAGPPARSSRGAGPDTDARNAPDIVGTGGQCAPRVLHCSGAPLHRRRRREASAGGGMRRARTRPSLDGSYTAIRGCIAPLHRVPLHRRRRRGASAGGGMRRARTRPSVDGSYSAVRGCYRAAASGAAPSPPPARSADRRR